MWASECRAEEELFRLHDSEAMTAPAKPDMILISLRCPPGYCREIESIYGLIKVCMRNKSARKIGADRDLFGEGEPCIGFFRFAVGKILQSLRLRRADICFDSAQL